MSSVSSGSGWRLIFMMMPNGVRCGYIQSSGKLSSTKNSFVGIVIEDDLGQQAVDGHDGDLAGDLDAAASLDRRSHLRPA